jgi:hypothetical protein
LSEKTEQVQVRLKYKELEEQFAADPQEAWALINQFFKSFIPCFEIVQKIWLEIDLQQLARDMEGLAAFSSDGASLLIPKNKLTDNEALLLWLTAYYLGHGLGILNTDALSKDDLQMKLGKSGKITSTRLGELAKNELVQKTNDEKFRITIIGVFQTQKEIIPKIKSKMKP